MSSDLESERSRNKALRGCLFALILPILLFLATGTARAGYRSWTPIGPTGIHINSIVVSPSTPPVTYAGTDYGVMASSSDTMWSHRSDGLRGARILDIVVDPRSVATLYAGTFGFGLYASRDGGRTWTNTSSYNFRRIVTAIAIDPVTSSTIYVTSLGNVFKSVDGGISWTNKSTGLSSEFKMAIAIDPHNHLVLYLGANDGAFRSSDGAETWTRMEGIPRFAINDLVIQASIPAVVYARSVAGIYKSADSGASWSRVGDDHGPLLLDPRTSLTVWSGIYRSDNGGATWAPMTNGLPNSTAVPSAMALHPGDGRIVYVALDDALFKTTDGGANWVALKARSLLNTYVQHLIAHSAQLLMASQFRGVSRLDTSPWSSGQWEPHSLGLPVMDVLRIAVDDTTPGSIVYVATNGYGIYYGDSTLDEGGGWPGVGWYKANPVVASSDIDTAGHSQTWAFVVDGKACYAGASSGGVMESVNGIAWQTLYNGLTRNGQVITVRSLALDAGSSTLYAGTSYGVYKSADSGANWTPINIGMSNVDVHALAIDPLVRSTIYAGSADKLYKTADGGQSWSALASLATGVNDVAITVDFSFLGGHPLFAKTLYVATSQGVFLSNNDGASWSKMDSGWPSEPGYDVATTLAIDGPTIYAGTPQGVFRFDWQLIRKFKPIPIPFVPPHGMR